MHRDPREGLDALRPALRERIAAYLSRSAYAAEAQRLLLETYYEGLADGVLGERTSFLAYVEAMVRTRLDAYGALEPTVRAVAQHEGAAEVLFTMLERLMARSSGEVTSPRGPGDV